MSKKQHDEVSAINRVENFNKEWFVQGLQVIDSLNLFNSNTKYLDLGCGNGEFLELINSKYKVQGVGADYSENHLKIVHNKGFETCSCNFDNENEIENLINKYQNAFDIITSFEVIEHIFDLDAFLTTIWRLLKKDGKLIISTPNVACISYRIYSMFRGNIPVSEGHHIRFFSPKRLHQTLLLNGFDNRLEYNFGKSEYYLDRAKGENTRKIRAKIIKLTFKVLHFLTKTSSPNYYSNLLFVASKSEILPIGLDPTHRNKLYNEYNETEKSKIIENLYKYRKQYFFDEHPGLRNFIDTEYKNLFHNE